MQDKLIAIRRFYGISQKEMAELIRVDVRTYVNKEKSVTQFKANEMFLIGWRFNLDIEDIFTHIDIIKHEVS